MEIDEQFIKVLDSTLDRENDIKRIVLYLSKQLNLNKENIDKSNVYKECISLLDKWINHKEIDEIKTITCIHLGPIMKTVIK